MRIEWGENNKTIRIIPENDQEASLTDQSWLPEVETYWDSDGNIYLEITLETLGVDKA